MHNTKPANKFLYKSKELQDNTGYYDYGFRQLDPALGPWFVQDALAEDYRSTSPYAYVKNNPINAVDIAGLAYMPTPIMDDGNASYAGTSDLLGFLGAGTSLGSSGLTGEDYDAFISMGGGGDGSSFSEWYSEGGRAGMSLLDWVATNGVSYVGGSNQRLFINLAAGMYFSLVDFAGDTRVVTSTEPLVGGDFNITNYGVEYIGNGQASIFGGVATVQGIRTINNNDKWDDMHNALRRFADRADKFGGRADKLADKYGPKVAMSIANAIPLYSVPNNIKVLVTNKNFDLKATGKDFDGKVVPKVVAVLNIVTSFIPYAGEGASVVMAGTWNYVGSLATSKTINYFFE